MKICSALLFFISTVALLENVASLAVMSIDLGTEWMKVGVVSPGVPMEIALNKESKRKSPAVLSLKDNIRNFGDDALTVGIRFPKNAYIYLLDLLGKDIDHPLVMLYQKRFPYYDIVSNGNHGILFKHDNETSYSPEELIAQFIVKGKEFAEQATNQPIKECVVTVPGFFNQAERQALSQAVKLANLKLLQLINDYTAVALNYGIFRSKDFNETAQYVMFYDMGASSTTATIVSYQTVKTKERGYVETHPEVAVVGVGYDRTLGGLEMQIRLRDHLARKFNEVKKTKNDVFKNPRAMAKLFKEAGRLKNVLSANAQHYAQVEGLLDEEDFKVAVARSDFEDLLGDLLPRIRGPVDRALKAAQLDTSVLNQVVLFGAGTRVPKVQELLKDVVNRELAKNLNTDEAAALGAVYKAADLSTGFKVKKYITKDAVLFPVQVVFEREGENKIRQVKRTLFGLMNPYPQKKIITFNKHTSDFDFTVNYDDLEHLPSEELSNLGHLNLTKISLSGVAEAFAKNPPGENVESKGIKAHFQMDESGLLNLVNVELVVEKTVIEDEEEGTLSKLGSTISKLFGGDEKEETKEGEEKPAEKLETNATETNETQEQPKLNETESKNATKTDKKLKPKLVTIKEPIKTSEELLGVQTLTVEQQQESEKKLKKLDEIEHEINRRAHALNELETFVLEIQTKLSEDDYIESSQDDERTKIQEACSKISDWLYDEGMDANADEYEKKLDELRKDTDPLFARVWEHRERPEALKALNSMLNHSSYFLESAKNFTNSGNPDKAVFTDKEVELLDKIIKDTTEWEKKKVEAQEKLKKYEPLVLTVKAITEKMAALDREVKYLVNKLKMWRPPVPPKSKKDKEDKAADEKVEEEKVDDLDKENRTKSESKSDDEKGDPPHSEL